MGFFGTERLQNWPGQKLPSIPAHHWLRQVGELASPKVVSVRKLELSLIHGSIHERGTYATPRQHRRAGPEDVGLGDPTLRI